MNTPERQKRLEAETQLCRRFRHLIAKHHLILVRNEENAFRELNLAHPVCDYRHGIGREIHDVLMSSRFIDVPVAVDAEIEDLAIYLKALIHGGEKHILASSEIVHRNAQKAVITPCVAGYNGSVAVSARLVRADNLPLERIRQVHEFGLVEFQKCHIANINVFFSVQKRSGKGDKGSSFHRTNAFPRS